LLESIQKEGLKNKPAQGTGQNIAVPKPVLANSLFQMFIDLGINDKPPSGLIIHEELIG
jgi:hypothetical protein